MKLRERIKKNGDYIRSVEMTGGLNIVKVVFPEKWRAYDTDDSIIKVARPDQPDEPGSWYYYCKEDEAEIDDIIDLVEETVEMNESVILKVQLLSEKVEELKDVFEKEPLVKLQTLKFVMEEPKKNKKSKTTTTAKKPKTTIAAKKPGRPRKNSKKDEAISEKPQNVSMDNTEITTTAQ